MSEEVVSAVKTVGAPDGTEFGILRYAPRDAARLRGEALVQMRQLVEGRNPDLLSCLKTDPGTSAEYAMSSAVMRAEDLELKADLARIVIEEHIAEGHYSTAVSFLTYDGVHKTRLPEYQNAEFLGGLYDRATVEGAFYDAWRIAATMIDEEKRPQIVKRNPVVDQYLDDVPQVKEKVQYQSGWEAREKNALEKHVRAELERSQNMHGIDKEMALQMLYDEFRFRDEGYSAEQPSELALNVARAYFKALAERPPRAWIARQVLVESKLSQADVEELTRLLPKSGRRIEKARQYWSYLSTVFSRLSKKA